MYNRVVLFGASTMGIVAHLCLKARMNIVAFTDNNKNKWGQKLCGLEILPPSCLIKEFQDAHIVITSVYADEIIRQLLDEADLEVQDISVFSFDVESIKSLYSVESDIFAVSETDDVFSKVPQNRQEMLPRKGYAIDFLGVATDIRHCDGRRLEGVSFSPPNPTRFPEAYLETRCLIDAVLKSEEEFNMIDLGAGIGTWSVKGAVIARKLGKKFLLTAVEGDAIRFSQMKQHFTDNGIDADYHHLLHAVVCNHDGEIDFYIGDETPAVSYRQYVVEKEDGKNPDGNMVRLKAVTLDTLLANHDCVDLINIDVQGAEYEVLEICDKKLLVDKVKKIYIKTHCGETESSLRRFFSDLGWENIYDFKNRRKHITEIGSLMFNDGVQLWVNPYRYRLRSGLTESLKLSGIEYVNDMVHFKSFILTCVEGLKTAIDTENHFEVASLLRDFAYKTMVFSKEVTNKGLADINLISVWVMFNLFSARELGVLCRGASIYLAKLYELFGFEAAIYNYGLPTEKCTHVITLVKIPNTDKLIVQDAQFNCTFIKRDSGEPLDFFDMMELIINGNYDSIALVQGDCSQNDECWYKAATYPSKDGIVRQSQSLLSKTDIVAVRCNRTFECFINRCFTKKLQQMLSRVLTKDMKNVNWYDLMLMYIKNSWGLSSDDTEKMQMLIHRLRQYAPDVYGNTELDLKVIEP